MSTTIRSKISKENPYYISKYRYLELKNFCLQYPEWLKAYLYLKETDGRSFKGILKVGNTQTNNDGTADLAMKKVYLDRRMKLIEDTALAADSEIGNYIFKAVTEGYSFTYLKTKLEIPCGRDFYYNRYRRFFWLLNDSRG